MDVDEPRNHSEAQLYRPNQGTEVFRRALDLCRIHDKDIIRGSFIRVTQNKILQWSKTRRLKLVYSENLLVAMVVQRVAASRQPVKDFTGDARFSIESGDLVINRLTCLPGYEATLVQYLLEQRRLYPRLWLRIWQEHPVDRGVVHMLSAKWMGTKVLSGGELVGVWCFGKAESRLMPVTEYWGLRKLSVDTLITEAAERAVQRTHGSLVTHYSGQYNQGASWSAFSLRGYGGRTSFIIKPSEMPKAWKATNPDKLTWKVSDTPKRGDLPEFEPLIDAIPGSKQRIRVMRLAPGGRIKRHSDAVDKDAGISSGKTLRIHVPICTNSRARFTVWDLNGVRTQVHMAQGEAWYLDTRKPHEVENTGETDRIHLVMDVVSCSELLKLLRKPRKAV